MAERRPAGATAERQANFYAARDEHRERQRDERARTAQLRASGTEDEEAYVPPDWDDEHGAWLVPVVELLDVATPDVLSGRARQHGRAEAEAEEQARLDAAAVELAAAVAELADDVLDEDEVVRGEEERGDGSVPAEEAVREAEAAAASAAVVDVEADALQAVLAELGAQTDAEAGVSADAAKVMSFWGGALGGGGCWMCYVMVPVAGGEGASTNAGGRHENCTREVYDQVMLVMTVMLWVLGKLCSQVDFHGTHGPQHEVELNVVAARFCSVVDTLAGRRDCNCALGR
jgi:hypothetical protein